MSYTLGEAARATGKTKPTIARAIRSAVCLRPAAMMAVT
jgi:hypothetical protein